MSSEVKAVIVPVRVHKYPAQNAVGELLARRGGSGYLALSLSERSARGRLGMGPDRRGGRLTVPWSPDRPAIG